VAAWLPSAASLRELYLLSNKEVGSRGTIEFFDALPRCHITSLHCDYTLAKTSAGGPLQPDDIAAMIRAIERNRKLQYLSLNLPENLTIEQQLTLSEAIKSNRVLLHLHLFMAPREGPAEGKNDPNPELIEPYFSIVNLRLALNRSRGKYIPQMLAFLMGTAVQLSGAGNPSPVTTLAHNTLFDRNMIYLIFQFAFG